MPKSTKNRYGGTLRCHGCGTLGVIVDGKIVPLLDGRFCDAACRAKYHDRHEAALNALVADGWEIVEGSEQLFRKDGLYRTIEEQMKCQTRLTSAPSAN